MKIERIDEPYVGVSELAIAQHCAFLVEGKIVEFEILDLHHAKVIADKDLDLREVIDLFRFYAYNINCFINEEGITIAQFDPLNLIKVKISDLKVSQFYIDKQKLDFVFQWIKGKEIAIPVIKTEGSWLVLDGHTRLKALSLLGEKEVWVYEDEADSAVFDFMREAHARGIDHVEEMVLCPHDEYVIQWHQFCRRYFMKRKKIGFIGCGNMGEAILSGILQKGVAKENIYLHTLHRTSQLVKKYGVQACESNFEVSEKCDWLILAVKPYMIATVIEEIKESLNNEKILISIAAGIGLNDLRQLSYPYQKIIRVMPNLPVQVGMGMSALSYNENCTDEEVEMVADLFRYVGACEIVEEALLNASICVSGSSPAYVFMLISAMMDGAIREGMSARQAKIFAANAVMGSAKLVLESEKHPEQLKSEVCSPKGTTIEAVACLEEYGFRNAILKAMQQCQNKLKTKS